MVAATLANQSNTLYFCMFPWALTGLCWEERKLQRRWPAGGRGIEDVELLDGAVEAVSGEVIDGRPGDRADGKHDAGSVGGEAGGEHGAARV